MKEQKPAEEKKDKYKGLTATDRASKAIQNAIEAEKNPLAGENQESINNL